MIEKLKQDMVSAMKNKEKEKLAVIRMVKAAMDQEHIDHKREINEELLIDVLSKQIKMRQDAISEFKKGNRGDLVSKNEEEITWLQEYLPSQLTLEEVEKVIDDVFKEVNPTSQKDMGSIMKIATPKLKGRCDMKQVSEKIKEKLQDL